MVDFPNSTKAKKIFLCLFAGTPVSNYKLPQGLGSEDSNTIQYGNDRYSGLVYMFGGIIYNYN